MTAPRGISQPPTSFIGSRCQGIHHAPLDTYKHYKNQRKITHFNEYATTRATHPFRCSQPLSNSQTPHPTTKMEGTTPLDKQGVASGPNSVSGGSFAVVHPALAHYRRGPLTAHTPPIGVLFVVLLRKEVIQPHLPIRLPCYDFVPIMNHTFGASLLAVRPATSGTTHFHDVTGGVYKARERIHRSVADLRLLVIPTSCRRIAACNPN